MTETTGQRNERLYALVTEAAVFLEHNSPEPSEAYVDITFRPAGPLSGTHLQGSDLRSHERYNTPRCRAAGGSVQTRSGSARVKDAQPHC